LSYKFIKSSIIDFSIDVKNSITKGRIWKTGRVGEIKMKLKRASIKNKR
jgi:hypothetical protein